MIGFTDEPKTGLEFGLSFGEYAKRPGISQTFLKWFDYELGGCPALARHNYLHPRDTKPPSEACQDGQALHYYLLDRKGFENRYTVLTADIKKSLFDQARESGSKAKSFSRSLATYKAWEAVIEDAGRVEIDEEELAVLERMADSISDNDDVMAEIADCSAEVSAFCGFLVSSAAGDAPALQLKARFDLLQNNGDAIIDLKSCRTANPREFAAQVARLGYDIQAAFYVDAARRNGRDIKRFGFLAQDKFPPYLCCIHWLPDEWIAWGRIRYRKILLDVAEAIRLDLWPGYSTGLLEPPAWLMNQMEAVA